MRQIGGIADVCARPSPTAPQPQPSSSTRGAGNASEPPPPPAVIRLISAVANCSKFSPASSHSTQPVCSVASSPASTMRISVGSGSGSAAGSAMPAARCTPPASSDGAPGGVLCASCCTECSYPLPTAPSHDHHFPVCAVAGGGSRAGGRRDRPEASPPAGRRAGSTFLCCAAQRPPAAAPTIRAAIFFARGVHARSLRVARTPRKDPKFTCACDAHVRDTGVLRLL